MHRPIRAISVSAAVLLSSGCAASVVEGSGTAVSRSGSSGPSSSSSGPTSTPVTSTPVSSPSSLPPTSLVTNKAGHYSVQLPGTPIRKTEPGQSNGVHFTVRVDVINSPYLALIGAEDFDLNLPADQIDTALTAAINSFQTSSGTALVSDKPTTFRGRKAREADLTRGAQHYTMLVVAWSSHRLYFFFAPQGAAFDEMTGSFESVG